jgi:DNA modification methylase
MKMIDIQVGDCLDVLKTLDDNSIDSIVTDPPYGLSFMGKRWDYDVPSVAVWCECLRVLKHGGHLLSFAGARTYHRMAVNIEDAGFEIRDQIMWVYGSGFPKSHNIGKAIGNTEHEGWGTALKPAHEPIVLARKPLSEKTIAKNVLRWGTGGINIDGCRVGTKDNLNGGAYSMGEYDTTGKTYELGLKRQEGKYEQPQGRFPANFIHDGSDEVVGLFPDNIKGVVGAGSRGGHKFMVEGVKQSGAIGSSGNGVQDSGSAARFFYCPKANKKERNAGCENNHPTVKPLALMQYLCRLVTPPSGVVLDPFMGSGTTGMAAQAEGFGFVGIEREAEYVEIAMARIING